MKAALKAEIAADLRTEFGAALAAASGDAGRSLARFGGSRKLFRSTAARPCCSKK